VTSTESPDRAFDPSGESLAFLTDFISRLEDDDRLPRSRAERSPLARINLTGQKPRSDDVGNQSVETSFYGVRETVRYVDLKEFYQRL